MTTGKEENGKRMEQNENNYRTTADDDDDDDDGIVMKIRLYLEQVRSLICDIDVSHPLVPIWQNNIDDDDDEDGNDADEDVV
uniref:Uncharacterized protein n=1 Tax=Onchocerca volvulus TaxID=6282 RepID=A0A8R1TP50_ONCVO